ncbi:hypothetical protein D923_01585, partial [Enterococcus faecalis 06-MB-S-04]
LFVFSCYTWMSISFLNGGFFASINGGRVNPFIIIFGFRTRF